MWRCWHGLCHPSDARSAAQTGGPQMDSQERRALTADELDAEQGAALPDWEEMALINPQPMPPSVLPVDGTPISHPPPTEPPIPLGPPEAPTPAPTQGG